MSSPIDRSHGFLPLVALRHADPTAVGVWDMDRAEGVMSPPELPVERARDQLVLARLHGQPLAIVHLTEAPETTTAAGLMEAVWRSASDAILEHVAACRCLPAPAGIGGAEQLRAMLEGDLGACPAKVRQRPPGTAAVIVCTTGAQPDALARTLRSLTGIDDGDFEIVVVDNRPSREGTRSLVESVASSARVRYVVEPRAGLARARNAGVAAARDAAFIAFTDDDVVVDREWLSWLLAPFARPRVQAVTGLVMPLRLGSASEKRFEHYAGFGKGVREATYDLAEHAASGRFLYPYWGGMFGSGNSMAFRRETLGAIGGFDTALGAGTPTAGGEDIAAFSDVILAGGQLVYQPRSLCWHEHRGDEQALREQVRNYGIGLTAVLWRFLTRDPRFSARVLGSVPAIARLARSRSAERQLERMPADLARLELQGRLLGPWRYILSRRGARTDLSGKDAVGAHVAGTDAEATHQMAGERPRTVRPGAADQITGGRHPGIDQAGAQTRT